MSDKALAVGVGREDVASHIPAASALPLTFGIASSLVLPFRFRVALPMRSVLSRRGCEPIRVCVLSDTRLRDFFESPGRRRSVSRLKLARVVH